MFELLRKIQSYDHNDVETQRFVSFWPEALDRLVAQAYAWEPEAFSHWRELPTPVRDGVALVLRRFGVISREELPCHTVEALATRHVAQYPLNDCPWVPIEGSRGVADGKIESAGQWPGERFEAYIQQFCDMDTWSKASLAAANQTLSRLNMTSAVHGLTIAPLKNLAALLKIIEATKGQLYHFLLHLRADAPEELFKIVHELQADRPYIADPVRYAAILRCKAVGVPVPEGIEIGTTLQSYEGITGKSNKNFEGMEQVIEALHTLGEKRAVALLRGVLASPYYKDHALPFLAEFDDPTLWEEARAAINTFTDKNFPAMELTAYSLGRLPPTKLSWIIQTYDASPDVKDLREGLARAVLHVLAGIGDRGEFVEDHVADAFIKFEGWEAKSLGDYYYENYVKDLLLRALKAIPRDRAIKLVQAQLGVNRLRPFAALAILQDPATTTLAFDKLSASAETFDSAMSASVKEGVKALGDQAHLEIRRLLATTAHPALVKMFREAMGDAMFMALSNDSVVKEETLEQQIRRLSGQLPVVKTRIYALNRASEDHKVTGLSRIGGTPPPLPDERWPKFEKQKMEFLMSLDLTHIPELAKPNSNAAVVALYLSSLSDNTACTPHNKESALVWLTREEVLAWEPLLVGDSGVGMSVEAIDVPIEALCLTEENILENYEKELYELHRLIYALPGRVLGSPIWLQQDEAPGSRFLFQFDNVLVDVNLGDSGVMYVFEDTAFWQCH